MVAQDIFPFAFMTDGSKEANFMGFSHGYGTLDTTSWKLSQKMQIFFEKYHEITLLQPSIIVSKGKISLATITYG